MANPEPCPTCRLTVRQGCIHNEQGIRLQVERMRAGQHHPATNPYPEEGEPTFLLQVEEPLSEEEARRLKCQWLAEAEGSQPYLLTPEQEGSSRNIYHIQCLRCEAAGSFSQGTPLPLAYRRIHLAIPSLPPGATTVKGRGDTNSEGPVGQTRPPRSFLRALALAVWALRAVLGRRGGLR